MSANFPYVVEISDRFDAIAAFRALSNRRHCVFLDSARRHSQLGRYSFVAAEPFGVITGDDRCCLATLKQRLHDFQETTHPDLPPLQGGAVGFIAYDMGRNFETIPGPRYDDFRVAQMCVGLYDTVVVFDHGQSRGWIVSQGFPEKAPQARRARAKLRAQQFLDWLDRPGESSPPATTPAMKPKQLAPQFETTHRGIFSNFQTQQYLDAVSRGIEYIYAGDIFQVNLAQRLMCLAETDAVSLYMKLRACNPAPFAGYFDAGSHQIVSASPERFLQVRDRRVETRPIKGTRPRIARPEADLFSGAELAASGKDLAENVMIVDLMRNDLSTVCEDDSVQVAQLCKLEVYEHVQHLVSVVEGKLRDSINNVDLIERSFPGGSITGAPKIRAMEIIAELEPTSRGAYCGSLGYLGFDGAMDLNILIRTITASGGWWQFPVGGGIVAQSNPEAELRETWSKAEGILQAVTGWRDG